jgi:two-component system, NarL family, sensor kinase
MQRLLLIFLIFVKMNAFAQHPSVDSLGRIAKAWAMKKPSFGRDTNLIIALSDHILYKNYFKQKDTKLLLDSLERFANKTEWNVGKGLILSAKCNYIINFEQEKGSKALDLGIKALEIFKKERNGKALFYGNLRMATMMLWNVNADLKTKTEGLNYAKTAVEFARIIKDTSLICHGLAYVANHYEKFGPSKREEALKVLKEGESFIKSTKVSYFAENLILGTMAAIYAANGNQAKCLEYIEKTLASGKRENDLYCLTSMAEFRGYLEASKNLNNAIQYFEEAHNYAKKLDDINVMARVEERLYGSYKYTGDSKKALEYLELLRKHQDAISKKEVQKIYADYDISNKEIKIKTLENERLKKDKELKILENKTLINERDSKIKELNFLKLLKINGDSLAIQKEGKIKADLNLSKKIVEVKSLENQKLTAQNDKNNLLRNVLFTSLLAGLALIFYIYNNNQKLQTKNRQLQTKNQEIEDALQKGTLQERKRVASELHDNLSAKISGIRMRMEAIKPEFKTEKEEKTYQSSVNAMAEVYTDVRLISHNLLPAELETKGLKFALENLVSELNGLDKTRFTLNIQDNLPKLKSKIEYELFSIILELSNNIMKHSNANTSEISLQNIDNQLVLKVSDNGIGFSETENKKGMGFANLKSRVESMKGNMYLVSVNGVKVEIKVPF